MMAVSALVSEIPYDLAICGKVWDFSSQNAMITMCICLIMLKCLDLFKETSGFTGGMLKVLILIAAIVWVSIFRAEYGLCIVLLTGYSLQLLQAPANAKDKKHNRHIY